MNRARHDSGYAVFNRSYHPWDLRTQNGPMP